MIKIRRYIFLFLGIVLAFSTMCYARYVISKSVELGLNVNASVETGIIDFEISTDKNIYVVNSSDEEKEIQYTINLNNNEVTDYTAYYIIMESNTEPSEENEWTEFEFTDNNYNVSCNKGIGSYFLWVKILYEDELGNNKSIIKSGRVINVVLGTIEIELEDEESEYLSGDVVVNIYYKGEGFSENRKAGYGMTIDEAKNNATSDNKDKIIIPQNDVDTSYFVYAYAEDVNGDSTSIIRQIDNIDNVKPVINNEIVTNKRIIIEASDSKSGIKEYDITTSDVEPTEYSNIFDKALNTASIVFSGLNPNTDYYVWIKDRCGNSISKKITTKEISYSATPQLDTWTNKSVLLKFSNIENCDLSYAINGGTILSYNSDTGIIINENCTLSYILQDGEENIEGEIKISNIDKIAPKITLMSTYENIVLQANDLESGIAGYIVTDKAIENIDTVSFTECESSDKNNVEVLITEDYLGQELQYNKKYYIYVKDNVGNVALEEIASKVDKIKPSLDIVKSECETNYIKVWVEAVDNESTLTGKYKYYISEIENEFDSEASIEIEDSTYAFENLEGPKDYWIKVVVEDKAGNISECIKKYSTEELIQLDGDIEFKSPIWQNNKQSIQVFTTTKYKMQYQIVKADETLSLENSKWNGPIENKSIINNLEHEDKVYVRLFDGINVTDKYATYNVINDVKVKYNQISEEDMSKISNGNYDVLMDSISSNNSKSFTSSKRENALTYNYYIKKAEDDNYTLCNTTSNFDDIVDIPLDEENGVFDIIVLVLAADESGTITRSNNEAVIIANDNMVESTFYEENRSYIDSYGYTLAVPVGFTVENINNIINEGLVVKDKKNNEFVWLPVNNFENYTEGLENNLYTENRREPTLIVGNSEIGNSVEANFSSDYDGNTKYYNGILGFANPLIYGKYLKQSYEQMKEAVNQYKGFYIARYETTFDNGNIGAKKAKDVLNSENWYKMYLFQDNTRYNKNEFYENKFIKTEMITGSQYEALMAHLSKTSDKDKINSYLIGNKTNKLSFSGKYNDDLMYNIYDLVSNVREWTQEASGKSYRNVRGGYFLKSSDYTMSTVTGILPTEEARIHGSRMTMYIKNNNNTSSQIQIESVEVKESVNKIHCKVNLNDYLVSVAKTIYSISTDGTNWGDEVEVNGDEFDILGLEKDTVYYLKFKVIDENNTTTNEVIKEAKTLPQIVLQEGDISVSKKYGTTENGYIFLKQNADYLSEGYYIEYQIIDSNSDLNENDPWTKGNVIKNPSEDKKVIARLNNGTDISNGYFSLDLKDMMEKYTIYYDTTSEYIDENGDKAYIPAGFYRSDNTELNTISSGLVIQDDKGNQFVWVPVKDKLYDGVTYVPVSEPDSKTDTIHYRPMSAYQIGSNKYYESLMYWFYKGNYTRSDLTRYRIGTYGMEPVLVSSDTTGNDTWDIENLPDYVGGEDTAYKNYHDELGFGSGEEFGKYMNEEYYNMVNSICKYGGYYIGRTETGVIKTSDGKDEAQSKIGSRLMTNNNWYKLYLKQDSNRYDANPYYNSESVVSSMGWSLSRSSVIIWFFNTNTPEEIEKVDNTSSTIQTAGLKEDYNIINNVIDYGGNIGEFLMTKGGTNTRACLTSLYATSSTSVNSSSANYGSRMILYINDQTDETSPVISFRKDADGNVLEDAIYVDEQNNIKVKVEASDNDSGSGIKEYTYMISSDDGASWTSEKGYGNTHEFTGLSQNTMYKIRVYVVDHNGNTSNTIEGEIRTNVLSIDEGAISIDSIYGKSGEGCVYFEISDEYKELYDLQYKVVKEGEEFVDENWQDGLQVDNLSNGDTIYTCLIYGDSRSQFFTFNITELEEFSNTYNATTLYTDIDNNTAYIPKGFKVGTSSINNTVAGGLVIENEKTEEQFVWVPVKDVVYNESEGNIPVNQQSASENQRTYKPMARYQKNYSEETEEQYFEGILYNQWGSSLYGKSYAMTKNNVVGISTNNREPSLITNKSTQNSWVLQAGNNESDAASSNYYDKLKFNSPEEFGEYLNGEYTNMILSVKKYGGFYIARYETSYTNGAVSEKFNQIPQGANWYNMYYAQDSKRNSLNNYYDSESVVTSMMWGSQHDAVLNWILEGEDANKVFTRLETKSSNTIASGTHALDVMNNIMDLGLNVRELTIEAKGSNGRLNVGGINRSGDTGCAYTRYDIGPTNGSYSTLVTSRMAIYIK